MFGKLEEFVAFDQDEASLAVVARDYTDLGIRAINGSVRQILSGKVSLPQHDFVDAAGLFDYLSGPVAAALPRNQVANYRVFDDTNEAITYLLVAIYPERDGIEDTAELKAAEPDP